MGKLYKKNEITFALVWIGLYVVVMNIALQICNGFDELANKTVAQLLVPVVCICLLAVLVTVWILRNGLAEVFGLCAFKGNWRPFLYFLPLVAMSCINLKNGVSFTAPVAVSLLMAVNLAVGGYVEEIIFRGFLFRGMAKENLCSAVIVSAVTFGVGHIVNLANTADVLGVLLQVCYAVVIGFLYTVIVWKGGSLWPCIASHMFVNATSVFAPEHGPFTDLITAISGQGTSDVVQICSAVLIMAISGSYAQWIWKRG